MRKLTAGLFCSIDGVVEDPNLWQFDSFDEQLGEEMTAMITETDTVILGRIGYQQWSGYWPAAGAEDPFAGFINPVEKYVASTTLTGELEWQNSTLISSDLDEFVAGLKQTVGGTITVCGGISIVRHLFFAGLLDELTLMIHPVVAGSGRHLFEDGSETTRLDLVRSRFTSKGNALLTYARATE